MKLIVLSGKMRSGKSTIADYLGAHYGYERISIARPLKEEVVNKLGFEWRDIEEKPPWMRQLLIALGQARRAQHPDYWIDRALAQLVKRMDNRVNLFVCDDCRFENELKAFRDLKTYGHDIQFVRVERVDGPKPLDDPSETELDKYEGFDAYVDAPSGNVPALIRNFLYQTKMKDWYDVSEQLELPLPEIRNDQLDRN